MHFVPPMPTAAFPALGFLELTLGWLSNQLTHVAEYQPLTSRLARCEPHCRHDLLDQPNVAPDPVGPGGLWRHASGTLSGDAWRRRGGAVRAQSRPTR